MAKRISVDTRRELVRAIGERYRAASVDAKARILDEFVAVTGYHRKHSIRVLNATADATVAARPPRLRLYDEAVREGLIVLWERSERSRRRAVPDLARPRSRRVSPPAGSRSPACARRVPLSPRTHPARARPRVLPAPGRRPNRTKVCRLRRSRRRVCSTNAAPRRARHRRSEAAPGSQTGSASPCPASPPRRTAPSNPARACGRSAPLRALLPTRSRRSDWAALTAEAVPACRPAPCARSRRSRSPARQRRTSIAGRR